jgi:hypothetical protein
MSIESFVRLGISMALVSCEFPLQGAEQSWIGQISDSVCAQKHPEGESSGQKGAALRKQCIEVCIRNHASYVIVSNNKVYDVENQGEPNLVKYAGEDVKVTGTLNGTTITISKIEPQ